MIIKGDLNFVPDLIDLWSKVFGDELSYIDIFFQKQYSRCETFCFADNGKVVSALYLLPCLLDYNGKIYNGRYLYAAATKTEYRGRGIMNSLVNESVEYCKKEKIDFICLLPANEGLYGYYGKCGFHTAMYRCCMNVDNDNNADIHKLNGSVTPNLDDIYKHRAGVRGNKILFSCAELDYIVSSMAHYGCRFICDDYRLIIYNEEDHVVNEFIGDCNSVFCFESFDIVYTPEPINGYGVLKKEKYGMIYPINKNLDDCSDIYMNLALD